MTSVIIATTHHERAGEGVAAVDVAGELVTSEREGLVAAEDGVRGCVVRVGLPSESGRAPGAK